MQLCLVAEKVDDNENWSKLCVFKRFLVLKIYFKNRKWIRNFYSGEVLCDNISSFVFSPPSISRQPMRGNFLILMIWFFKFDLWWICGFWSFYSLSHAHIVPKLGDFKTARCLCFEAGEAFWEVMVFEVKEEEKDFYVDSPKEVGLFSWSPVSYSSCETSVSRSASLPRYDKVNLVVLFEYLECNKMFNFL